MESVFLRSFQQVQIEILILEFLLLIVLPYSLKFLSYSALFCIHFLRLSRFVLFDFPFK
ncbi:hypothetical protein LEP1GSC047_0179 [Leptospira inadai serovar Lyme str. 10]|uniref:Uncharacterized protein n=1 Tax=Leptospira inadai serovar Lyme str. 10 TaxID=1049790 RepID=V6HQ34_9LEPT|nr:hypothetical protein LEP1GSC047_0179 [Leptospira inadai serovar Lyme str. 10]